MKKNVSSQTLLNLVYARMAKHWITATCFLGKYENNLAKKSMYGNYTES